MTGAISAGADVLADILDRRHSARAFLSDPVPDQLIDRMFEMAQRTASWCNAQPWQVVLLSGDAVREFGEALTDQATSQPPTPDFGLPTGYNGVYLDRRRQSGFALYESIGITRDDKEARTAQGLLNYSGFGAPHIALITTDADLGIYGAIDCGAYLATLLTAASALGIAAVPQAALAFQPDWTRAYLGLGEDRRIVAGVSLGFEDSRHPINRYRIPRENIENVVTRIGA